MDPWLPDSGPRCGREAGWAGMSGSGLAQQRGLTAGYYLAHSRPADGIARARLGAAPQATHAHDRRSRLIAARRRRSVNTGPDRAGVRCIMRTAAVTGGQRDRRGMPAQLAPVLTRRRRPADRAVAGLLEAGVGPGRGGGVQHCGHADPAGAGLRASCRAGARCRPVHRGGRRARVRPGDLDPCGRGGSDLHAGGHDVRGGPRARRR